MRQTEKKKVKIGGATFYISPFGAMKAANLSGEIGSVIGPVLSGIIPLMGQANGDGGVLERDLSELSKPLSEAFSSLDGDRLEKLMRDLLITNGNVVAEFTDDSGELLRERMDEDLLNELFCGEVQDMYLLAWEVIRLNYNGFFKRASGLFGKASDQIIRMRQNDTEPQI